MPADITKANSFSLTTDYPLDKIIYQTTGSLVVPASTPTSVDIPHGLPFTPLSNLVYSTTSDFAVSYVSGSGPSPTDPSLYQLGIDVTLSSTGTNNSIAVTNFFTYDVTIYYRLYSFEPIGSSATLLFTNVSSDTFELNTDYNYSKLYLEGKINLATTTTVVHGLGYIPQTESWIEFSTQTLSPQSQFNALDTTAGSVVGTIGVVLTSTQLSLVGSIPGALFLHYRIYLDA